jgi:hypothetical protein
LILNTDLRRRKLRNRVPITFATSEPYVRHMGMGGVGASKTMLESEFRSNDIKLITNAKVTKVEAGRMFVTELDEQGAVKKEHELACRGSASFDESRNRSASNPINDASSRCVVHLLASWEDEQIARHTWALVSRKGAQPAAVTHL